MAAGGGRSEPAAGARPRILHLFASFDEEPAAMRAVQLINALGNQAEHAIVSGDPARRGAARHLARSVKVSWPKFPPLAGSKLPGRLLRLAGAMAGHDLICTYGYGATDAALAHTLFADVHKLPPLVHHELALDPGEAAHRRRRGWYRRFALGRTAALVVPDGTLERMALEQWDQPRTRVRRIAPGINTRAYAAPARRDVLPGLIKRRGELWIGAFTGSGTGSGRVPDLAPLVRALPSIAPEWQLVVIGDIAQARAALEEEAEQLRAEDRVHFTQEPAAREDLFALLDIAALPAGLAEAPAIALEAMAAGLPVLAPRGGEVSALLASDNGPWLAEPQSDEDLAARLKGLADAPAERKRVGQANRTKAREEFDQSRTVERMRALYFGLMGLRRGAAFAEPPAAKPT